MDSTTSSIGSTSVLGIRWVIFINNSHFPANDTIFSCVIGRIVGGTVYPGLMITSGGIHWLLHLLNIPVHIRDICVFLAPIFSGLTAISTYLLTKELWSPGAGLFAASFIAIVPGYISRSVAGSYDNEGIAIFALQFTYYLWVKSVKTGSIFWAASAALSYFYMVSGELRNIFFQLISD